MSVSQHPVAVRLEQQVGEGTRLLATVMALPLVDGIFPALILAGALASPLGIIEVGLLVFGGSATLAVVLAEMLLPFEIPRVWRYWARSRNSATGEILRPAD